MLEHGIFLVLIAQRYQLISLLGSGGMGAVYRARDRLTGQEVALKQVALPPELRRHHPHRHQPTSETGSAPPHPSEAKRTFRLALAHEFRTLATLRHPNIVSVLDFGFDAEHEPFFTMQLLDQPRDLLSATRSASLPEKLTCLAQLLRALVYLHRHHIVHRDIKPSNVLVIAGSSGPVVKLLDFGIASQRDVTVEPSGTLTYMAPELLMGQPPTPASDLYTVGVLLHQMLFGRTPQLAASQASPRADLPALGDGELTRTAEETAEETLVVEEGDLDSQAFTSSSQPSIWGEYSAPQLLDLHPIEGPLAELLRSLLAVDPALRPQQAEQALRQLSAIVEELTGSPLHENTAETAESFLQAAELIGREQELALLDAALLKLAGGAAASDRGGFLLIGGESGVGKSRLLEELRTLALVRGIRALRGQAVSNGGTAYQLFQEAVRALALCTEFSDQDAAVLKGIVPDLPAILGRVLPDAPALGAKELQERSRSVLLKTLIPKDEPLLLLLEDVHWAQEESRAILSALAVAAKSAPLLVVASFRDDEQPELAAQLPAAKVLPLRRLDAAAILRLSESMLGEAGARPELVELLLRETEGNALFIIEVLRALAEEAGGLDAIGNMPLPSRVAVGGAQAVVQRRLLRAPPWTRALLKLAAVSGRRIDRRLLGALLHDGELDPWLQACTDAAILEVYASEWRFAHDKLREGLLSTLPASELAALHLTLGEALERVYPPGERPLSALADHFQAGGNACKAALYASQAGSLALRSGALHEALALLETAKQLQEETQASPLERATTLRRLSRTLLGMGRTPESTACVIQAMKLLGQPVPGQRLGLWLVLGREAGIELRHRLLGPRQEREPRLQDELREFLALIRGTNESLFITSGQQDKLLLFMLRALHAAERLDDRDQQIHCLSRLAYASYLVPLHSIGRYYLRQAEQRVLAAPLSGDGASFYAMSAYFGTAEGEWERSMAGFDRWIDSATRHGFGEQAALGHSSRAATRLLIGDLDGALADGEACLRIGQRLRNPIYIGSGIGWRAPVEMRRGELDTAYAHAKEALGYVIAIRDVPSRMSAHALLGRAAFLSQRYEEAGRELDSTLAHMQKFRPAAPSYQLIYSSVLLTALELCERLDPGTSEERVAAEQRVQQALLRMAEFAFRFPMGWSHVFLGLGRSLAMRGQRWTALALLAAGLPVARRYRMLYDQALLHLWSVRLGGAPEQLDPACQLFAKIEATHELAAARALLLELSRGPTAPESRTTPPCPQR